MFRLKPSYVTDSNDKKVAVQLDLKTFEKIEEVLENYGLYNLMDDKPSDKALNVEEAQA